MNSNKMSVSTVTKIEQKILAKDFPGIDEMMENAMIINSKNTDYYVLLLSITKSCKVELKSRPKLLEHLLSKIKLSENKKAEWVAKFETC